MEETPQEEGPVSGTGVHDVEVEREKTRRLMIESVTQVLLVVLYMILSWSRRGQHPSVHLDDDAEWND